MKHLLQYIGIALLLLALGACGGAATGDTVADGGTIEVNRPWVRAMEFNAAMNATSDGDMQHGSGMNSAAYMTLRNPGGSGDALIAATTDVADVVELHTTQMDDGIMRMRPVERIEVPADGEVALQPGGFHVMLIDLQEELPAGETVDLVLTFENAGDVPVTADIRQSEDMNMDMDMDGTDSTMDEDEMDMEGMDE